MNSLSIHWIVISSRNCWTSQPIIERIMLVVQLRLITSIDNYSYWMELTINKKIVDPLLVRGCQQNSYSSILVGKLLYRSSVYCLISILVWDLKKETSWLFSFIVVAESNSYNRNCVNCHVILINEKKDYYNLNVSKLDYCYNKEVHILRNFFSEF